MSDSELKQEAGQAQEGEGQEVNLLEEVIKATKQTEKDYATSLMKTLTEEALKGVVVWDKNLTNTINKALALIDNLISEQVKQILHNKQFQKLEGTWRGLRS